jgi:PAS domain S-box-containing protein
MNSGKIRTVTPIPLILLFLVILAGSIFIGELYYKSQKKNLLKTSLQELSTITDMKVRQLTQWRLEHIGDGTFLSQNVSIIRQFSGYLKSKNDRKLHDDLMGDLKALTENYDYKDALFVDKKLAVRLFYPNRDSVIGDYLKPRLPEILNKGKVVLTDFHHTGKVSFVHLDLIVPLKEPERGDTAVIGAVVLRVDPDKVLFPLIQSWPVISNTSESFIFNNENDSIVYLSELRYFSNASLNLKKSLTEEKLASAMAVRGYLETSDAIDYRGIPVFASMKKVPESPWFLLAKTDRAEIYEGLSGQLRFVIIIVVLIIVTSFFLCAWLWWQQRLRFYREKFEAEQQRLALVKHYDYILKFANDLILLMDGNFNIIEANDKVLESYQYNRNELIGNNIRMMLADSSRDKMSENQKILNENGFALFESLHKRKDSSEFSVEISARKVEIEGVTYYQSIMRDITDRKNSDEVLRESEERFRKIFEDSPIGMAMTGKDMGILRANDAFCNMLGKTESELHGLTFRSFTHPEHIKGDELAMLRLVSREIPVYYTEKRYIKNDGSIIWGSTTVSLIRNNYGEVQFFLAMVEDITSRKIAEAELIAAKEKAEESDRLKTAFLHNVSHEIRTPMNAIIGFSTLLNESGLSEEERSQYADIIFQSSNQLLSIINDIVDLASIETGQVKLNMDQINLNSTLRMLYDQFSYKSKLQKITLSLKTSLPFQNAEITTDNTKLVQILSNLINNAFKFTVKGKISFGYDLKSSFLEFFVIDTGIGIPAEHLSRIFDRFYQVDSAISRQHSGTGLGLSICKAYIELMGGSIRVSSKPDEGTEFRFTIPYQKNDQ